MAPPKKVDTLKRYQTELTRSINWRNDDDLDGLWRRMIDLYKGKHYEGLSSHDRMVVNRAFSTKNVIAPSVAVNNPRFVVNARKPSQAPQAMLTEEVLNYLWRAYKYKREFRLGVDDFLIIGHGWYKVGYKFVHEKVMKPTTAPGDDTEGDAEQGVDDRDDVEGNVESEIKVTDDRPFVERISPFDIFVDPDARHMGEARWIAQRIKRPVADVRVDSRYSKTHRVKAAKSTNSDKHEHTDDALAQAAGSNAASKGFVDVWEFYDLREGTVCTFVQQYEDGYMIDPQPTPYAFGAPFVMLRNYEVPDQFYPMGELEAIEELQLELNQTRTEMMMHRRRNARKYLYSEDMFDEDGLAALKSDVDNTMVKVNTTAGAIEDAVRPMPNTNINPDSYNMSEIIEGDMDVISGVSDYQRGGAQANIRRTATEAAMIQDSQNARASDKLAGIEEVLAEIGEKLIMLLQAYMTEEQVVRVVGSDATPVWLNYDKDYIQGQFDFEVEGGSTQPRNESFRAQRAMQLMDAMAPFLQMGVADPGAVMRKVLADGFGVKDPAAFLMQQQAPMEPDPSQAPGMPPAPGAVPPGPMGPEEAVPPPGGEQSEIGGIPQELLNRLDVGPSPVMALQG